MQNVRSTCEVFGGCGTTGGLTSTSGWHVLPGYLSYGMLDGMGM